MGFFSIIGKAFSAIINKVFPKQEKKPHFSSLNSQSHSSYYYPSYHQPTYPLYSYDESRPVPVSSTHTVYATSKINMYFLIRTFVFFLILNFMWIVFFVKFRVSTVDLRPKSFLQLAQLNEYPLPNDILVTERDDQVEDEVRENIIATIR